ncbi:FG-GAP repeat protein, partial [Candidatus Uhrbacteria bacterium]|nr:FG-GAP repeat protein [Candidatus Uhrbacteria bacterium]
ITGDGVDDLVVGAPRASSGEILVYAGSELYALGWAVMFTAIATSETDAFGSALASGDVNGDGIADLIVGAPGANGLEDATGAAYLFEGPLLTREADFPGTARGDRMGASVDLDDLDGDGYADAIIGAPGSDNGGLEAGLVTIVAGSSASVVAEEEVTLRGEQAGAQAGTSVAFAHDMNGDGNYDLVVGAPAYDAEDAIDAGRAYLVLGPVEGSHTLAASDHVTGYTTNMRLGLSVLGDTELTGDSMADIVLGGPNTSYPEAEMTGIVLFLAGY